MVRLRPQEGRRIGFVFVFVAVVLAAGWVVGHLTASIGWGFVAMVAGLLLELPIAMLLLKQFQPVLATLPPSAAVRLAGGVPRLIFRAPQFGDC
jgi:hypothetical protein